MALRHNAQSPLTLLKEPWIPFYGSDSNSTFDFLALELLVIGQGHPSYMGFVDVLRARTDAGLRLKKLRMKEYREPCSFRPEGEVDELELLDELDDRVELPEIRKTDTGERWLSWRRDPSDRKPHQWPSPCNIGIFTGPGKFGGGRLSLAFSAHTSVVPFRVFLDFQSGCDWL